MNRHLFKEDLSSKIENRHMKRSLALFIFRELQVETTIRFHMAITQKQELSVWEDVKKRELWCTMVRRQINALLNRIFFKWFYYLLYLGVLIPYFTY